MKHQGYGVLADGKPCGIWPVPMWYAQEWAHKTRKAAPSKRIEVVPVSSGEPVPLVAPSPVDTPPPSA